MTCHKEITQIRTPAKATHAWLGQITDVDGAAAHQDDIDTIEVDVWEINGTRRTPVGQDGKAIATDEHWDQPDTAAVMFTSYQHDDAWDVDSVGFNSRYLIAFPHPDKTYLAKMTFTLTNGQVVVLSLIAAVY